VFIALLGLGANWASHRGDPPATVDPALAAAVRDEVASQVDLDRVYTKVAVIGDSYTAGSAEGGNGWANWASRLVADLQPTTRIELSKVATGGIGYLSTGTAGITFLDEAKRAVTPDVKVVIVLGSRNDLGQPGDVGAAATSVYDIVRAQAPAAKLIIVGPPWINEDVPAGITAARDDIRAAAQRAGATFVDPIADRWFFGADSLLIGSDHIHPTDTGHRYMADKIRPYLQDALVKVAAS
jgi:lysophospholipase L1-like esterase